MEIRKLQNTDKAQLLPMMVGFYNSPAVLHKTPSDVLSRVIDDCLSELPFVECYVCVDDKNTIAGYTMLSKGYSTEYGGICIQIEDLFVAENCRGKHIGSDLLNFVENIYTGVAVRLRLEVEPSNKGAIALYRKLGYKDIAYNQMSKEL